MNLIRPYVKVVDLVNAYTDELWCGFILSKGVNVKVKEKSGMRKDRFSSLQYNIYVCMLLEQKLSKVKKPRSLTSLPSCVSALNF